jgi:ribosomal protein S18 acetylase RimI-like enzyme
MYYLATAPAHRGRGVARALVSEVEERLAALGCPKAQLMVRSDNLQATDFYITHGYEVNEVLVLGKRLIEDEPPASAAK